MTPKLSILLPVFNEEAFIEAQCASLTRHDYDFELVIVDDHSTDGTLALIQTLASEDDRIKVFSNHGAQGIAPTVNVAYGESNGEFVTMIGGDDTVRDNYFSSIDRFIGAADGNAVKLAVFSKLKTVSDDSRFDGQVIPRGRRGNRSGPCMVYSRLLAELIYPLPAGLFQEDAWIANVAEYLADDVEDVLEPNYNYRIHTGNTNPRHLSWEDFNVFMTKYMANYTIIRERLSGDVDAVALAKIDNLIRLGELRENGDLLKILVMRSAPIRERLRFASSSHRLLHALRSRFYTTFSGW